MHCKNDNNQGVNTCNVCGEWLCEDCSKEINGRIYCESCASETLKVKKAKKKVSVNKNPNILLTMLFSGIPGCAQMYMGLMERGLLLMSLFFGMAYLQGYSSLFFFVNIVLWFYNFFDSLNIRRKIIEKENIDELYDIKNFFSKNKVLIIGSIMMTAVLEILDDFKYTRFGEFLNGSIVLLIIAFVLLIMIKMFKGSKSAAK